MNRKTDRQNNFCVAYDAFGIRWEYLKTENSISVASSRFGARSRTRDVVWLSSQQNTRRMHTHTPTAANNFSKSLNVCCAIWYTFRRRRNHYIFKATGNCLPFDAVVASQSSTHFVRCQGRSVAAFNLKRFLWTLNRNETKRKTAKTSGKHDSKWSEIESHISTSKHGIRKLWTCASLFKQRNENKRKRKIFRSNPRKSWINNNRGEWEERK